jgi:hypothetical protein
VKKYGGLIIVLAFLFICGGIFAQDTNAGDDFFEGDIDSLFGDVSEDEEESGSLQSEPENPPSAENTPPSPAPVALPIVLKKIGYSIDASFNFAGGYIPGWKVAPWHWQNEADENVDQALVAKMESTVALDFQVSDVFRVRQAFSIAIPNLAITIPEFFFDYSLMNRVFFRVGKFAINWGISPNFPYANLPSRIPTMSDDTTTKDKNERFNGDIYLIRADIPVGVGGLQLAAMTRSSALNDLFNNNEEITSDLGRVGKIFFGLKYNVAVPIVDIDVGLLYNKKLNTRAFLSLKTTLFDRLELYSEGLLSYNLDTDDNFAASASIGMMQDFFDNQLSVNAELYYNGEEEASYVQSQSFLTMSETVGFIDGLNAALNIRYKPVWLPKTELFFKYLHGFSENTAQLVPGFRLTPLSNLNLYVAVPMALGSKDGLYYRDNLDEKNRPFSVNIMLTFSGSYRYTNTN